MRALVTGGAIRLGHDISLYLAGQGYDVAVHYATSVDEACSTVSEIEAMGQKSVSLRADLLDEAQSQTLVSHAVEALGGDLSLLVNNASIFEHDTIDTATRSSWDRHMESNLRAPFVLTQELAKQAPKYELDEMNEPVAQALVINMLDQRVRKLTPDFMSYTLAKMGLWAFTQTAARALAPNIRVNAIGPGPTVQGVRQSSQHFTRQRAETVLGRGSNPSDITAAVGYFLKAPAITGQLLCVDGGQHLGWQTPDVLGLDG
jgi:NAD(P)-dependent dehydrogenase (short-subunit alcohol dehydrogenase family)